MVSVWSAPKEEELLYFMEFRPGGAYALFGLDQHVLRNARVSFDQLHIGCYRRLQEAYESSAKETQFFQRLDEIFLSLLSQQDPVMFLSYIVCGKWKALRM